MAARRRQVLLVTGACALLVAASLVALSRRPQAEDRPKASGDHVKDRAGSKASYSRKRPDGLELDSIRPEVEVQKSKIRVSGWRGGAPLAAHELPPDYGVVVIEDRTEWQKLWFALDREEDAPEVDFDKEFIVVAILDDKNDLTLEMELVGTPDDPGPLRVWTSQTLVGYLIPTERSYEIALIKREGVLTVNGQRLKP